MNMINELILTAGPSITDKEINYVNDAVRNGWNNDWNKYIVNFEHLMEEYIGVKHAVTTSSCTGALHLSLLSCGIGPGDEVIVPDITWVASASAVMYVGATPVFCDIEETSWCLDIRSAEKLLSPKTKAIIPVHLYGHPANMPAVVDFAKKNNLKIIEDAAPSIGAEIDGKKTGSFGDAAAFSFQGAKILSTGEGGMFLCNNDEIFKRFKSLSDHGRDPGKPLAAVEVGYKYKMSNLQAAMGFAQLERVDELVNRKIEINSIYRDLLNDCKKINVSKELPGCKSIHWMTSIELVGANYEQRADFMAKLKENLVDSRPVFSPLSHLPMFTRTLDNLVADRIGQSAINLPSGHNLTLEQIEHVAKTIKSLI
ncbi:DegT/DnrJ/EryC1/StrS family aminotransferase [Vibrio spartinae]|uniref:DegT/DnrJ/EryC1/StrS family aminotransferase n=1 Tax=Vibrio spartinae TaxID=1918945 RepID=UPI0015F7A0C4|nr:DegT/DnrJ/EryC1/StrS family aminotransferase [Vibrio spartinae]